MENTFKSDLRDLIDDSNLTDNQKLLWELFMKISNEEEDEAVFEAASESEDNLELLTAHLRDKIWDMKEYNSDAWETLIGDEEKYAELL
jgi:hypothetical protein